ncbi:MAG: 30S ribosomal protein S17 [Candidatus Methanolliviera hydrocarbonicum]|uniref:Small ribosomal subunit protein uS17 n=1 Tax=Candidatus Methanolliviera hydrocarbonicum TaxID=2491085 RepID=A0A520KYI3_9EURY|nr:MAG: 30S ribosomal protein S17 [Candidatus Methanolliviera hydrocarbonicum]
MRDIGLNVKPPESKCSDINCPFHGNLSVRGQVFIGKVVNAEGKTVVVKREMNRFVKKYERYERRSSKIHAHDPPCIKIRVGDLVKVAECRPISKTKSFVVVERL